MVMLESTTQGHFNQQYRGTAMTQSETSHSHLPQPQRPRREDTLTKERICKYEMLVQPKDTTFHLVVVALAPT
jgi:hypothetical protein